MRDASVKVQIASESVPSIPWWFGEVTVFAHVLMHCGLLKAIEEHDGRSIIPGF
jgi:hypothetical protein